MKPVNMAELFVRFLKAKGTKLQASNQFGYGLLLIGPSDYERYIYRFMDSGGKVLLFNDGHSSYEPQYDHERHQSDLVCTVKVERRQDLMKESGMNRIMEYLQKAPATLVVVRYERMR